MDNKFRPESNLESRKEYSFDEGVDVSVRKIQELLKTLNRDIYVIINGSSVSVGKSALETALTIKLKLLGIQCLGGMLGDKLNDVNTVFFITHQGRHERANPTKDQQRIIEEIPVSERGDLRIGIYRPDRMFSVESKTKPAADIMIRNTYAKDKKQDYRSPR